MISLGGRTTPAGALISSSTAIASPLVAEGAMLNGLWIVEVDKLWSARRSSDKMEVLATAKNFAALPRVGQLNRWPCTMHCSGLGRLQDICPSPLHSDVQSSPVDTSRVLLRMTSNMLFTQTHFTRKHYQTIHSRYLLSRLSSGSSNLYFAMPP